MSPCSPSGSPWRALGVEVPLNDTCDECDATATGGGNDALLLKCESRFASSWREICWWQCPFCDCLIESGVSIACFTHTNDMICVGNAIRSALTPSRVAKAILSAQRTRILWLSPACGPFRVAEDGTAADVDDKRLPLPPQPWLAATPRDVGAVEWERWRRVFDDYNVISPIGQWG